MSSFHADSRSCCRLSSSAHLLSSPNWENDTGLYDSLFPDKGIIFRRPWDADCWPGVWSGFGVFKQCAGLRARSGNLFFGHLFYQMVPRRSHCATTKATWLGEQYQLTFHSFKKRWKPEFLSSMIHTVLSYNRKCKKFSSQVAITAKQGMESSMSLQHFAFC